MPDKKFLRCNVCNEIGPMKNKIIYLLALVGGILGFTFHLIWHSVLEISLFTFSAHIFNGIIHTLIGAIIGSLIGFSIKKKQ